MHITIGSVVTLVGVGLIWLFATMAGNDPGCAAIETSTVMAEPAKAVTRLLLLCWLV